MDEIDLKGEVVLVDAELVVAEVPGWFAGVLELGADSFKEALRGGVAELAAVLEDIQPTRGHFAARRYATVVVDPLPAFYRHNGYAILATTEREYAMRNDAERKLIPSACLVIFVAPLS